VTRTLSGNSGIESITLTNVGSEAYDFKVEFYDGTNTFIAFPAVIANKDLVTLDKSGNLWTAGSVTDGDGGTLTVEDITSQAVAASGTAFGGYQKIYKMGKLVIAHFNFKVTSPNVNNSILSGLPKPVANCALSVANGSGMGHRCFVNVNGELRWDGNAPTVADYENGSVVYVTNE
jgi:hypothetical protein